MQLFALFPEVVNGLLLVLLAASALAIIIYVPVPFKHYLLSAVIFAAAATYIWGEGYRSATSSCQLAIGKLNAQHAADLDAINRANEKAQIDAVAKAKAEDDANMARVKADLDREVTAADASKAEFNAILGEINKASADADRPAPGLILDAIARSKK